MKRRWFHSYLVFVVGTVILRPGVPDLHAAETAAAPPASAELLVNADFERGSLGWQADSVLKREGAFETQPAESPRKGRIGVVVNRSDVETAAVYQTVAPPVQGMFRVRGLCRAGRLKGVAGIAFYSLDARGRILERRWVVRIPEWGTYGWQAFNETYRPPRKTASVQVRLAVYRVGTVRFDDLGLSVEPLPKKAKTWGVPLENASWEITRYRTSRPIYRMAVADLDNDGRPEFLLADVDGGLRCRRENGNILWERNLGGLALDIAVGDLSGDSRPEIVVCSADTGGRLRVLDAGGRVLWTYSKPGATFSHVAVGNLDGQGWGEVLATHDNHVEAFAGKTGTRLWSASFGGPRLRSIAVADVTGDDRPEVVVAARARRLFCAAVTREGKPAWYFRPTGTHGLSAENLVAADLDGNGETEIILGGAGAGKVACIERGDDKEAVLRWLAIRPKSKLWPQHRDATGNLGAMPVQIAVRDFCPDRPGLETLAATVDALWLLDRRGRFIWEGRSGILLLDLVPWRDVVYVPSSGFRDTAFYRLRLTRGGKPPARTLAEFVYPNPIYDNLDKLSAAVHAKPSAPRPAAQERTGGAAPADGDRFHVVFAGAPWPYSRYGSFDRLAEIHDLLKSAQSDNLEFLLMLWPKDLPVELDRAPMEEPKRILKVARFLEEIDQPFLFFIDHGCKPNLSLPMIAKTLETAPRTCRGFYVAENTARYPTKKWDEFVDWATTVMDLCLAHGPGTKVIFKEMFDSWALLPADARVRERLFQPKYRDVLVAMYATNNPYAPELQIGGMLGLKHTGLIGAWGISTQHWSWSWSERGLFQQYADICPADVLMRMELTAACLGARWFHIEGGQEYLRRGRPELDPAAARHRELVYEMIRKRLLLPVSDSDNLSFSNTVVLRSLHAEIAKMQAQGKAIGNPLARPVGPLRNGLLGVRDSIASTPPEYLPSYAYNVRRYCEGFFPETPFGFVRIVPDTPEIGAFTLGKYLLRTNGDQELFHGKNTISASSARGRLRHLLTRGAEALPFQAEGAAVFTHRVGKTYRVWLVDPGFLTPQGVDTFLRVRLTQPVRQVRDLIDGRLLTGVGGVYPVHVPAGAFRLLEVTPRQP
ncbi:MAG: PQQ-binding-like beta-propeller repeat protein [Kiritimatiellaeota bacterium]|nr:PQQ-binding-like beta-propeller repeat protein [Kiritimatiellota bacterium]